MRDLKYLSFFGGKQRLDHPSEKRRQSLRRLRMREHARAAAEPRRRVFRPPVRTAHGFDGYCDLLYDKLPVRDEPRPARARDRGRIQLCRLRHRAGRLHDDEPLRREHGAA